jgi:16S rRNA (guanine966-N2)-methyltransferase
VRIVAGKHRGRRLTAPKGKHVRPTSDRVRESLFSILTQGEATLPKDVRVLDAFAGSGALGLEALSRGAACVTFIDKDRESVDLIEQNLANLGEEGRATVLLWNALRPGPANTPFNLVFLDPPYGAGLVPLALEALRQAGWIATHAQIVIEQSKKEDFKLPDGYSLESERSYGNTHILFVRANS